MSDTAQGPGWWLASDGKWYPAELWTGPPGTRPDAGAGGPTPQPSQPLGSAPPGYASYGSTPSGGVPGGHGGANPYAAYGYQYSPYGTAPAGRRTNGMAVASLVCGIGGFLFFVPAILGIIFGFVARSQIRQSDGRQGGQGLATAGIIVGFAWVALFVVVFAVSATNTTTTGAVLQHLAAAGGLGG
jgi:uncharacterized protein DUF4190